MNLICFDMEGVFTPEIWVNVAKKTGIEVLCRTTRDEPDYDKLMNWRIVILREHQISLKDIQNVIATLPLLEGAKEFFDWARSRCQVVITTDSFVQFAGPFIEKLGNPLVLCHELNVDEQGMICGYTLRQQDQKTQAVKAFQGLNYQVIAIGDSYNDMGMIQQANHGILFRPPDKVREEFPGFPVAMDYSELRGVIERLGY
ncbi:MAG: bifunctional phosphoserine phosphatase/homoserine phosphotransferase ThrH [Bacteroidota bacterium]